MCPIIIATISVFGSVWQDGPTTPGIRCYQGLQFICCWYVHRRGVCRLQVMRFSLKECNQFTESADLLAVLSTTGNHVV